MSLASPPTAIHASQVPVRFPPIFRPIHRKVRYKIFYGGRGSAKSWSVARYLILRAYMGYELIACLREFQSSIADSVHKLLENQIDLLGLRPWFEIYDTSIRCTLTGAQFIFKGLRHNSQEIKSTEGITIAWVEEAQSVSEDSWKMLTPTVRTEGEDRASEIIVTFNPDQEDDATYKRFVLSPPSNSLVIKVNWRDNPHFPRVLEEERLDMLSKDPDSYDWIWEGNTRTISEAVIFKGRYKIETFPTPGIDLPGALPNFNHGVDWGYAKDPTAMTRNYVTQIEFSKEEIERRGEIERRENIKLPPIRNEDLWIDQEAWGVGVELGEETERLFDTIRTSRTWPIKADSARPETISMMRHRGFNISAAEKWPGCIEDRIAHLKGFHVIHIHTRCTNHALEARLYKWKVDKTTGKILPIPVDSYDHLWDATGYSLDGAIIKRGSLGQWANL